MKILLISYILFTFCFLLSGCDKNNNGNNAQNNVSFTRISTEQNNNSRNINNLNNNENNEQKVIKEEIEISNFSTPLKSGVKNRIVNIKLTSDKINGYILKNGETFSFNQLVGPCTAEEGYQKAEIYVKKQIKYALGGGNCQVSTTLYNAVLAVPGMAIVERHEHGKSVDYIEDGKDATVSYNTLDLKFKNDTGYDIKLYAWCDDVNVCAKITKLVY